MKCFETVRVICFHFGGCATSKKNKEGAPDEALIEGIVF